MSLYALLMDIGAADRILLSIGVVFVVDDV